MFLVDWFYSLLSMLGWNDKEASILFLGLDNAGKTTLVHMLRDNRLVQHAPTHHATSEELKVGNVTIKACDLGGHKQARPGWKNYFSGIDAIVFLVDTYDKGRIGEAKEALDGLLADDDLKGVPFLVLGNKTDLPDALSEVQLRDQLGLHRTTGKGGDSVAEGVSPIEVYMSSIPERQGYGAGFKWLNNYL